MMDTLHILSLGKGGWGGALLLAAGVTFALSVLGFLLGAVFGAVAAGGRLSHEAFPSWSPRAMARCFGACPIC